MKYTQKQYDEIFKIFMGKPRFYLAKFLCWILFRKIKVKIKHDEKKKSNGNYKMTDRPDLTDFCYKCLENS